MVFSLVGLCPEILLRTWKARIAPARGWMQMLSNVP